MLKRDQLNHSWFKHKKTREKYEFLHPLRVLNNEQHFLSHPLFYILVKKLYTLDDAHIRKWIEKKSEGLRLSNSKVTRL